MTTPNPPIPGHHLLNEGSVYKNWSTARAFSFGDVDYEWVGGCACGAKPPEFPNLSKRAMQRWHRQHKAALRGQQLHDTATDEMQVEALKALVRDMLSWVAHRDGCETPDFGTECICGTSDLLQRAFDALGGATQLAAPAEGATEPAPELQVPIQVDTRPCSTPPEPTVADSRWLTVSEDEIATASARSWDHSTHRLDLMSDGEFRVVKL